MRYRAVWTVWQQAVLFMGGVNLLAKQKLKLTNGEKWL